MIILLFLSFNGVASCMATETKTFTTFDCCASGGGGDIEKVEKSLEWKTLNLMLMEEREITKEIREGLNVKC